MSFSKFNDIGKYLKTPQFINLDAKLMGEAWGFSGLPLNPPLQFLNIYYNNCNRQFEIANVPIKKHYYRVPINYIPNKSKCYE